MLADHCNSPFRNVDPVDLQKKVVKVHNQKVAQSAYNSRQKDKSGQSGQSKGKKKKKKRAKKTRKKNKKKKRKAMTEKRKSR